MNYLKDEPKVPGALSWEVRNQFGAVALAVESARLFVGVCVLENKLTSLVALNAAELDVFIAALVEARGRYVLTCPDLLPRALSHLPRF